MMAPADRRVVAFCVVMITLAICANSAHVTREGCTCTSDCGASVDFGLAKWDWCYTANKCGMYSYTRFKYYDYCVYPANRSYESHTAEWKDNWLWPRITAGHSSGPWPNQAGIFAESVKTTFEDLSDVANHGRTKYIHSVGAVAQVELQVAPSSPFTGIFATGSSRALLRLSTAKEPSSSSITPGFGLKFLRDNATSGNLVAMPGLDGQSDFNIWKLNYTNHLTLPTSWALKIVAQKFTQASRCPLMVGLTDIAQYGEDGKQVATPVAPFHLVFVPNLSMKFPSAPYGEDTFLSLLEQVPVSSTLFEVYASRGPGDAANILVGTLKSRSKFTRSAFGDTNLFFRHQYMEEDFRYNPSWLPALEKKTACGDADASNVPPIFSLAEVLRESAGPESVDATEQQRPPCPFAGKRGPLAPPCPYLRKRAAEIARGR